MLPEAIELIVVTPERQLLRETVVEVEIPGLNGAKSAEADWVTHCRRTRYDYGDRFPSQSASSRLWGDSAREFRFPGRDCPSPWLLYASGRRRSLQGRDRGKPAVVLLLPPYIVHHRGQGTFAECESSVLALPGERMQTDIDGTGRSPLEVAYTVRRVQRGWKRHGQMDVIGG